MGVNRSDLLDYYYGELYPELQALEKERKKVLRQLFWAGGLIAAVALWLMAAVYKNSFDAAVEILGVAVALWAFVYHWLTVIYRKNFKNNIFRRLIVRIDPSLLYLPMGMIPRSLFQLSGLFDDRIDNYEGNDLIKGKIGKTSLEFSDLNVEKEYTDSKGRKHRTTIFAGTFIVTEFHKHFRHTVKVYPDIAEKYLGVVGSWLQNAASDKLVRMDSPAFEKEFKVLADDPVEAHYLLTPNIMERVVQLKRKAGVPVYLSFKLNKLFIAIENGGR
jgi:hypothetical protein